VIESIERFDADEVLPDNAAHEAFRWHHLRLYQLAANFLQRLPPKTRMIIDAASGKGYGYDALAVYGRYLGLDICPQTVRDARRRRPSACYLQADLESELCFQSLGTDVDVFVSFETGEHLHDPETFMRRVRGVLNPTGCFLFSAPTCLTKDFDPFHRHDYVAEQWRAMLQRSGFEILYEETVGFNTSFNAFTHTCPTTLWQKLRIVLFNFLHPKYFVDRFYNWLIHGRFVWTSRYFACKLVPSESRPSED
jgi:SAM-dependent methyltransferase